MLKNIAALGLFFAQTYLVLEGEYVFGKAVNPFVLFAVSLAIPIYFFRIHLSTSQQIEQPSRVRWAGIALGMLSFLVGFWALRRLFWDLPDPAHWSDVVPQIDTLYTRFARGEFPYKTLQQFLWYPYPVYMPMHWLPLWITYALNIDVRWAGVFLLVLAGGVYGWSIWGYKNNVVKKALIVLLPSVVLWAFLVWGRFDLGVSYETTIAAYYLVLAAGLNSKNLVITTIGIILCLLSRYTMVFWLPLFLLLLLMNVPIKKNLAVWVSILLSIVFIYIIPFYAKDPKILVNGLTYHNECAIGEWVGFGTPPFSATFESGIYFGEYLRSIFSGDMEHRVFQARVLQAALMIGLVITGLVLYKKWKHKLDMYDIALPMLYVFLLFFFMFGVLTYTYYYFPLLMISGLLCGRIMLAGKK